MYIVPFVFYMIDLMISNNRYVIIDLRLFYKNDLIYLLDKRVLALINPYILSLSYDLNIIICHIACV